MSEIAISVPQRRAGRGRPFKKGRSGNPAGKPRGARNKVTLAVEALLDGEAEGLTRLAVDRARAGSDFALRLCLDRIIAPLRERTVHFAMPPVKSAADLAPMLGAITAAVAEGRLTPNEAVLLSQVAANIIKAIETSDFERRLQFLEKRGEAR